MPINTTGFLNGQITHEFVSLLHSNVNSLSSPVPTIIANAHCDNDLSIGSRMTFFFGLSTCNPQGRNRSYMSAVRRDPVLLLELNRLAEIKMNLAKGIRHITTHLCVFQFTALMRNMEG